jgi:hypothetical protein
MAGGRRRRSSVIALAVTIATVGAAGLLTACGPGHGTASGASTAAAPSGSPAPGAPQKAAGVAAALNGTAHNGLTISNGTRYVVMNGRTVDFGTLVRDLAWSPNGRQAAFIDGQGDLVVSDANGAGRVIVARNPGGQVWSHPTWQVTAYDKQEQLPARDNLLFAVVDNGVSHLESISAKSVDGTPKTLSDQAGAGNPALPQTDNMWPNIGGTHGDGVYANSGNGEVYIRDDYLRQQGGALTRGSQPAMSPSDDEEIVFVRSVGGHDHLFLETTGGHGYGPARDLTPKATTDYTEPAWSPDGKTIAARTPAGIVTLPANGSAAPVRISDYVGLPAYRTQ